MVAEVLAAKLHRPSTLEGKDCCRPCGYTFDPSGGILRGCFLEVEHCHHKVPAMLSTLDANVSGATHAILRKWLYLQQ